MVTKKIDHIIMHKFHHFEVSPDKIDLYAQKYVEIMAPAQIKDSVELIQGLEGVFDTSQIQKYLQQSSIPEPQEGTIKAYKDIYRSDLGELMMVHFFEEKIGEVFPDENAFIIPLKNLYDRERQDLPGRGIDAIGYRSSETGKITLLLGEAKVSEDKNNPPGVVAGNKDSIYKTHQKHKSDTKALTARLVKYIQKLQNNPDAFGKLLSIFVWLTKGENDQFDTVYACCLVRDSDCVNVEKDFGKVQQDQASFEPGLVHFVMPVFTKPIGEMVSLFEEKVQELAQK